MDDEDYSSDTTRREHPEGDPDVELPSEAVEAHVDDEMGSASMSSQEDWVRANSRPPDHDGRAPTRTYFDPRDVREQYPGGMKHRDPAERRSWTSLAKWQDGANSDISRGGQNWWADKQRWVDTFSDLIGATHYHRDRTKYILEKLDMTPYRSARIPAELVIVGILSLLIDADVTDFECRALRRDGTKELLADLDSNVSEYEQVRKLLRAHDGDLLFPEHV